MCHPSAGTPGTPCAQLGSATHVLCDPKRAPCSLGLRLPAYTRDVWGFSNVVVRQKRLGTFLNP